MGLFMSPQRRILAVHDISCFGRCSLTVALPIISATGLECTVIPTAILSTHTGGFTGYTFNDMTDDILPIVDHWRSLGLEFDAIYTGFLGSSKQIGIIKEVVDRLKGDGIFISDPAMADCGKMYPLFNMEFASKMATLCSHADIVIPNITEACFMLGIEYHDGPYTEEFITSLLYGLTDMGCGKVVLTGVSFEEGKLGSAAYDPEDGKI